MISYYKSEVIQVFSGFHMTDFIYEKLSSVGNIPEDGKGLVEWRKLFENYSSYNTRNFYIVEPEP